MKTIQAILLWIYLSTICGCAALPQTAGDRIARGTKDTIDVVGEFLESPTGKLIPTEVKAILGVIGAAGLAGAGAWEEWRRKQMVKTNKAIVQGLERAAKEQGGNPVDPVKAAIKDEMLKAGGEKFYRRANKIVDQAKIAG
jgi:hypothetical protein